jgi:hypothetical protein
MAIKISGTSVIDNSRNLENISKGASTITTLSSGISTITESKVLVNREFCEVIGAGVTVYLPQAPDPGNEVNVAVGNFTDTKVSGNGERIMGLPQSMILDVPYKNVRFVYIDSTVGWRVD